MTGARNIVGGIAVCMAGLVCSEAASQPSARSESEAPQRRPTDEEVIVRGQDMSVLREALRRAEEAVYDRFNAINSDDEYDIYCRMITETGSRMLRRVCEPNFRRELEAERGEDIVRALQGSPALSEQFYIALQFHKRRLMTEEMRRLAATDAELLEAIMQFADVRQAIAERGGTRRAPNATLARQATGEAEPLPFGAETVFDVHVGRDPWTQALRGRTFTIELVSGEIREIGVDCDQGARALTFAPDVEWTLPDAWGRCVLVVDAKRDSRFYLYEFD